MRLVHFILVLPQVVHEFLKIGGWKRLLGNDEDRRAGHQADWRKILGRVIFEIGIERRGSAVRSHVAHHDGVPIRLGLDAASDAGSATGAGHVLHDDWLAERLLHVLADDAGDGIGRTTGCKGHDHRDWLIRVLGSNRSGAADNGCKRESNEA